MVCFVKVVGGDDALAPPEDEELKRMDQLMPRQWQGPSTRLACRLYVLGPGAVLEKRGVKPPT